jgi:ribosomal protein L39E
MLNNYKKTNKMKNTKDIGIDLFEDYTNIPAKVQTILDKYEDAFVDGDYKQLEKAHKALNKIGYTFEYYLDGQAYDLRPIGTKGKSEMDEFRKGGSLDKENSDMVLNNNKQISHHTKELANAVNKNKNIPAWVVAKINRSATDISDATHYLEGVKYKKGGGVGNELTRGEIENKIDGLKLIIAKTKKQISTYENTNRGKYNNLWQEKVVPLQNELNELSELWGKSKYAKGGMTSGWCYSIGGL